MGTDFDDFVEGLQNQIFEETRAAYGDVAFQRWLKPQYMYVMDYPDGYGRITGPCGDTMQIFLKFENEKVKEASFQTELIEYRELGDRSGPGSWNVARREPRGRTIDLKKDRT